MDVTLEDQQSINRFSRLNTFIHEINAKLKAIKAVAEDLEEAENELMLTDEETVPYLMGECFVRLEKDEAEERVQEAVRENTESRSELETKQRQILKEMAELKTTLYGKFGNAINLEE